jgi:hypothetical protein
MKRISEMIMLASGIVLLLQPTMAIDVDETGPVQNDSPTGKAEPAVTDDADSVDSSDVDNREFVLRHQFRNGDSIRYRSEKIERLSITVGEQSKTDVTRTEQVRQFDVSNLDESGRADLLMQFESVELSRQVNDDAPVVYRSSMKPDEVPRMFAVFAKRLQGKAPRFTVVPTGTPLNDGGEVIVSKDKDSTEAWLMMPLPENAVKIGDAWKHFSSVKVRIAKDVMREIRMLTTYRLDSVDDGIARIKFTTSPTIRLKSTSVQALLIAAVPRGYCLLDIEAGRIVKRVARNNRSVYGLKGPGSLLTYSAEAIEDLLPEDASVSQR